MNEPQNQVGQDAQGTFLKKTVRELSESRSDANDDKMASQEEGSKQQAR